MLYANNKGADQPAHLRSLISTFVVPCLDSIIPLVSISEISSLYRASVAAQASMFYIVATPEDRFSCDEAHLILRTAMILNEPRHDKTNKMSVCPVKTQIGLGIRPV